MPDKLTNHGIDEIIRRSRLVALDFDGVFSENMVLVLDQVL